ncbi:AAA family ATPase [Myxacorys almedinensis]|uniref:AAA family ATPase n=1 Tax=Myxacorys almedinensis A TaxID=2690445 RepID=A0A8J7YZ09_9CYAN|nr:AAA family ATPase [Myxacorys almedinensis]NDJ15970.1 AAA family ATPase [Myxacorys almedinensis A]
MTSPTLPPLVQSMLHPAFYPHGVTEPIQLVQTHISYVLLTGDFVYKLKKPMNYGFLDFSTLEKRKHFCHEELRLNQRGAAELYLDVLPIIQDGETFGLGGEGEAVDYVVKMRQFPQEALLSEMYDRGELREQHLEALATVLADFHKKAPTNDYILSFGEVSQIRQAIDENYDQTVNYIGVAQTQQQFDETKAYTDTLFAEQTPLFDSRVEHKWIRECHGDVHLRNICFWHDKILLFDCIEFNEPFRFVDVMFDIAYIIMDFDARHRSDLANLFLNAYLEQTGDWEGLQVLPLYLSRQAYVRAKVTSFLLGDPSIPEAVKQDATATASGYYQLAWHYTQQKTGKLVMMAGLSGSGKSTIARSLARQWGAIQIRSDAVRKHLGGVALDAHGEAMLYSAEMTQKTYDRLLNLGITLAAQGYTVILDAKYDRQALRSQVIETAQAQTIALEILHCTAPADVLETRVQQRQGDISDATADVLTRQHMEPFTDAEQPFVKTIDTTQDLAPQLAS